LTESVVPPARLLLDIAALEARARAADSRSVLAFSIANDPYTLLGFRQALVFDASGQRWELLAVSGLARPTEDSPYLVWLRRAAAWLAMRLGTAGPTWLARAEVQDLPPEVADGWAEWWSEGLWCLPLRARDGASLGWVCYLLDGPTAPILAGEIERLAATWAYCWEALGRGRRRVGLPRRPLAWAAALALGALAFVPVRQTALAPAEVVSLDAVVVASPLDGVVHAFHVRPNQSVERGQPLLSLDDTTLRSRLEVAQQGVAVADAELASASQRAFDDAPSKADLAVLTARAQERRAELAAIQEQLGRIEVTAPRQGVAVFADPNDWIGKPVVTGERIMQVADPAQPGMLIHLPVADAIALDVGAPVKLYLSVRPLSPLDGRVIETSYQAVVTEEGVASYRLRASFDTGGEGVRVGLKGTAKLYGGRVALGYYVLRRPLAALRERSGL
jgi:hypothetical protein